MARVETKSRLIAGLLDAAKGKTIVLVSHQPALIAQAGHVVRLEAGRVWPAQPARNRVSAGELPNNGWASGSRYRCRAGS